MTKYIVVDLSDAFAIVDRLENNPDINTIDTEALMSCLFAIIHRKTEINNHIEALNELLLDQFYNSPVDQPYTIDIMQQVSSELFQALDCCYNSMCIHGLYLDNLLHYDYYKRHTTRKAAFKLPSK